MRIRIDLAYDGTAFSGWARQPGLRTVEEELATALGTVLRTEPPRLTVGGRTDAGVHARGSVAHADLDPVAWAALPGRSDRPPAQAAVTRLAGVLPPDVVVRAVREVPDAFDARFSAVRRRYTYRICDDPPRLDPLRRHDTVRHKRPLDVAAMDEAARALTGLHDFAAFCKPREGATTIRTLLTYGWARDPDGTLVGTVVADAFCHSMVRALVGSVVPVGEGRYAVGWPVEVRDAGRRDPRVTVMPAHGLCLEEISYPPDDRLGERAAQARARRTPDGGSLRGPA
ncbi:tRNA pseudouridine(38-40) synthase TruA [Ornithinicoccus hortensis]|uniref:tRNA pseudouridine synthase A n=1 Tax=Ornithinicoccus hortensis TaxID=82346 RepID=A0A542YQ47_9MICO|nr:tRNA pseudouridine(38-40) synthase TruA [Ornithinicoccus hortensis]TQL50044.1 tRNA pseudouridine38-40 synthase [Ornithinicoccus hortensis]